MTRKPATQVPTLQRIAPPYEQVQIQLRHAITSGEIAIGTRLPTDVNLATTFGVSRATIREALRGLATQGLITTTKGPNGGGFVAQPSVEQISGQLQAGMSLIARTHNTSLQHFHDLRRFLEVPAARLAAAHRTEAELAQLAQSAPPRRRGVRPDPETGYERAKVFHSILVRAAHNPLLEVATDPVLNITQTRLDRQKLTTSFHTTSEAQHHAIADAISSGDANAAGELMEEHLEFVNRHYARAWITGRG